MLVRLTVSTRSVVRQNSDSLYLYRLGLEVVVQAFQTALPTIPRLFNTTKWGAQGWKIPVVDSDAAGLNLAAHTKGAGNGFGVQTGFRKYQSDISALKRQLCLKTYQTSHRQCH